MESRERVPVRIKINGNWVEASVKPWQTLLDFIREDMNLTGTKRGCERGDCGACTVLLEGKSRTSCNMLAVKANGREITTIEGLSKGANLHPVQEAFIEAGAIQCGYCTPGMVLEAVYLLEQNATPTDSEIKEALTGHICRCTGYVKIIEAIKLAAERLRTVSRKGE